MRIDFSAVVPVYNELESLPELVLQLEGVFKKLNKTFEIVFVDDGSNDGSLELMQKMAREKKNIRIFSFRKNLGKANALSLGFNKAEGEYILTLDADLQDDPTNLPSMLQKLKEDNLDMVSGWRKDRRDSPLKTISSKLFNRIAVPLVFKVDLHDLNCGLKLYKRELVKEIKIYGGMHRFIPVIASELGFQVGETPIVHHARKYGKSKYKPTKILTDIPDLLTLYFLSYYIKRPLHFFGKIGILLLGAGGLILTYLFILRISGNSIGTRPLLTFGVLLFTTGVQTIFTGMLADLVVSRSESHSPMIPLRYDSDTK
ncbi:MAG: glycosyltransferase family 2 protein [Candidatus Levybacteria bacterium]|nr:glycosyltransferase family 2 protein [Candidatus Levybacteria bacterium]